MAPTGAPARRFLADSRSRVSVAALAERSWLGGSYEMLRGRSVLILLEGQLAAALAMTEIDGVARRMVLCMPDLSRAQIASVLVDADIDTIVADDGVSVDDLAAVRIACSN